MDRRFSLPLSKNAQLSSINSLVSPRPPAEQEGQHRAGMGSSTSIKKLSTRIHRSEKEMEEESLAQEFAKKLNLHRSSSTLESERILKCDPIKEDFSQMGVSSSSTINYGSQGEAEEEVGKHSLFGEGILNEKSFREELSQLIMEE